LSCTSVSLLITEHTLEVMLIVIFFKEGEDVIEVKVVVLVHQVDIVGVGVIVGVIKILVTDYVFEW
jgi:hypothetical protein